MPVPVQGPCRLGNLLPAGSPAKACKSLVPSDLKIYRRIVSPPQMRFSRSGQVDTSVVNKTLQARELERTRRSKHRHGHAGKRLPSPAIHLRWITAPSAWPDIKVLRAFMNCQFSLPIAQVLWFSDVRSHRSSLPRRCSPHEEQNDKKSERKHSSKAY